MVGHWSGGVSFDYWGGSVSDWGGGVSFDYWGSSVSDWGGGVEGWGSVGESGEARRQKDDLWTEGKRVLRLDCLLPIVCGGVRVWTCWYVLG